MYRLYQVVLRFEDRVCGGIPKHPNVIRAWVEARTGYDDERAEEIIKEAKNAMQATDTLGEKEEIKAWTGFKVDDCGLYLESRQVMAMLKESANVLKGIKGSEPIIKIKNLKARLAERVFVEPSKIYLLPMRQEPDGYEEHTIRVMTPRGPRSAIKRFDYIEGARVEFTLRVLDDGLIGEAELRQILDLAEHLGLGANRSQGYGQFEVASFAEAE